MLSWIIFQADTWQFDSIIEIQFMWNEFLMTCEVNLLNKTLQWIHTSFQTCTGARVCVCVHGESIRRIILYISIESFLIWFPSFFLVHFRNHWILLHWQLFEFDEINLLPDLNETMWTMSDFNLYSVYNEISYLNPQTTDYG